MRLKKLSLKGLADFMTASSAKQRTILRQHKYPDEDEAHVKIVYYRDARDRIAAYHSKDHSRNWLGAEGDRLSALAASSKGRTRTRLNHNARALREYERHFGKRRFHVLKDETLRLEVAGVRITVHADLHVLEKGQEKLIKLDFSKAGPAPEFVKIMCQGMFDAAESNELKLSASGILYLDVARGKQYRGARVGSRMRKNIEAACQTISDVWDHI